MAQRVQIILEDDLDGSEAVSTVTFAFDGVSYEIDLSAENEAKLRDQMAPWLAVARRSRRASQRRARNTGATGAEIRAWAQEKGMKVNARGRVPAEIKEAYEAENG